VNAPIYPKSLVGTTIYYAEIVDGEYNDETEAYDDDTVTVTAGIVMGISLDEAADFHFLAEKGDGTLVSWPATDCSTIAPEAST